MSSPRHPLQPSADPDDASPEVRQRRIDLVLEWVPQGECQRCPTPAMHPRELKTVVATTKTQSIAKSILLHDECLRIWQSCGMSTVWTFEEVR